MTKYIALVFVSFASFGQPKGQKLVWQEDFNGTTLNEKEWNFEIGDGCPNICGWGNNEKQIYTKNNHMIKDGKLIINIRKEGEGYTSTRITTAAKKEFQYGRMEVKAKIPTGKGIWPAFWMLGSNIPKVGWPKCGEIDILEYVGREPDKVYTSLHTQDSHGNTINSKKTEFKNIEEGFHLYSIDWTKDKIEFFVDNQSVYKFSPDDKNENTWPFNQPFYFIINAAVGGNFGGHDVDNSIFPQEYLIDYIRVYQ
ncbi:glycoside hydrolase family 16 protein [Flavobacterium terrisoli]|uniref:glycoside hydrolase family 16 protein n=1 Tax=Flavobacterium terrisoli TaxID=3242195 RepID=UPI002543B28A|nr:glycoside hydrolase family 16 protein [Flavobacterium buctense]